MLGNDQWVGINRGMEAAIGSVDKSALNITWYEYRKNPLVCHSQLIWMESGPYHPLLLLYIERRVETP